MTTLRNRFSIGSLPPEYTPTRGSELSGGGEADIELTSVRTSLTSSPPSYAEAFPSFSTSSSSSSNPSFHPTLQLQLSTVGKSWFSNPFPTRPETIPIFSLQQQLGDHDEKLEFISIRPEHGSGSCYLTVPTTPTPEENDNGSPIQVLSTTRYRFGPGRPPVVRLFSPYSRPLSREVLYRLLYGEKKARDKLSSSSSAIPHSEGWHEADSGVEIEEQEEEYEEWDTFPIEHPNLLTRTTIFRTRLGTFEWRYASRAERKHLAQTLVPRLVDSSSTNPFTNDDEDTTTTVAAATATATADSSSSGGGHNRGHGRWKGKEQEEKDLSKHNKLDNVLILSRLTTIANAQNLSSTSHHPKPPTTTTLRRPIAYLLRSSSFRTPGSGACYAGNGGRLVIDLSLWNDSAQEDQEEEEGRDQITTPPRSKLDREMATITIVTTCLVMLKKEVDRRRAHQIAIIAGGGGGGP
ncbi:hypothetical protein VTJ04DRAFT_9205 [Mycothermus thermophilus]|uniref:uncharacterized protein n=1 Tax=Humicola insolens TaxID=85995 RepID=UPI0037421948